MGDLLAEFRQGAAKDDDEKENTSDNCELYVCGFLMVVYAVMNIF